jgi:dTDP-4-dehydrorhamnose reductase
MQIKKVLVTGANGQLGWELTQLSALYPNFDFVFADRQIVDLSQPKQFEKIINSIAPDCIINTAAYTAVDKAEVEKELANTVNALAVGEMARVSNKLNIPFITFSTDYVFNGNATSPYLPDTLVEPVNFYGETKAAGEQLALAENKATIIIRTSWVFSSHGNNLVKTMLRLMKEKESLNIVGDQKGRPTYAKDLALATIKMVELINAGHIIKGIYHYANAGETTWFGFAEQIKKMAGVNCLLTSVTTDKFPTPAKRPSYSVLDTRKIETELSIQIPEWKDALLECYLKLKA